MEVGHLRARIPPRRRFARTPRWGPPAAAGGHRGLFGPAVRRGIVGLAQIIVVVGVEGAPADGVHDTPDRGRGEMIARGRDRRDVVPTIRGGIVDRARVDELAAETPAAYEDDPAVHEAHPGRSASRR